MKEMQHFLLPRGERFPLRKGGKGGVINEKFLLAFFKKRKGFERNDYMSEISPYDFMENEHVPPRSNRGAQPSKQSGLVACVDWFQVTFKKHTDLSFIASLLQLDNERFIDCNGQYGYKKGLWSNGIFLFYDGNDNMGIHLQLTGTGCRYVEQNANFDWFMFFADIHDMEDYNVTRFDLAIDDYTGYFTIDEIIKKVKKGELVSRFKSARRIESIEIKDGKSSGNTVYFGSSQSRLQIRMYEKNHERRSKGIDHNIDFWNRTELQMRKERAHNMFTMLLENEDSEISTYIKGVLNNYLRFVNKKRTEKNKSKWPVWKKWQRFIGDVEKIKLTKSEPEKDLIDSYNWIDYSVSATLAMLDKVGIDLKKFIDTGKTKLTDKHYKKINDYIKKELIHNNISPKKK